MGKQKKLRAKTHSTTTILFFIIWPVLASWLSFTFSLNAFVSPMIFFGIPALLLSYFKPASIKQALLASTCMLPFMAIVDYVAQNTQTWLWPLPNSLLPFKLFGVVSIEVLIWIFLHVYVVILYYQYFYEKKYIAELWNERVKELITATLILFTVFIALVLFAPGLLLIPYWYLVFGIVAIVPVILLEEMRYPLVFLKLLKVAIYFFYLNLAYEFTALKLGWWSFPSRQFLGHLSFLGITLPFEEFFFWLMLLTLAILSYYEYFFNREK